MAADCLSMVVGSWATGAETFPLSPNPPNDTDVRREDSGRRVKGATGETAWAALGREVGGQASVAALDIGRIAASDLGFCREEIKIGHTNGNWRQPLCETEFHCLPKHSTSRLHGPFPRGLR